MADAADRSARIIAATRMDRCTMEFCKAQAAGGREWIGEAMQARHFVSDRGHRASCLVQHSISPGTQTSRAIQKIERGFGV